MKCFVCEADVMGDAEELLYHIYYHDFPFTGGRCWCGHRDRPTAVGWNFIKFLTHCAGRVTGCDSATRHTKSEYLKDVEQHWHDSLQGVTDEVPKL